MPNNPTANLGLSRQDEGDDDWDDLLRADADKLELYLSSKDSSIPPDDLDATLAGTYVGQRHVHHVNLLDDLLYAVEWMCYVAGAAGSAKWTRIGGYEVGGVALRDILLHVKVGDRFFNTDTSQMEIWDGTQWIPGRSLAQCAGQHIEGNVAIGDLGLTRKVTVPDDGFTYNINARVGASWQDNADDGSAISFEVQLNMDIDAGGAAQVSKARSRDVGTSSTRTKAHTAVCGFTVEGATAGSVYTFTGTSVLFGGSGGNVNDRWLQVDLMEAASQA